jgi:hypothetical protein
MLIPKNRFALLFLFSTLVNSYNCDAQQIVNEEKITPYGKPIVRFFSNFHTDLSNEFNESAFEITRTFLGYKYFVNEYFSTEVKIDISNLGDALSGSGIKRYTYFKHIALMYNKDKFTWYFGLIPTKMFKVQEKYWGHRYLYKTLPDEHEFGYSADAGTSLEYRFNSNISADMSVMNGEGFMKPQLDNTFRTGFGITVRLSEHFTTRFYYDFIAKEEIQSTFVGFLGWKDKRLTFGIEVDYMANSNYVLNQNQTGYSTYASYLLSKKFEIFGRFDKLASNKLEGMENSWNNSNDGQAIISGIQFQPVDEIKIALNYRNWYCTDTDISNQPFLFLSFEFNL